MASLSNPPSTVCFGAFELDTAKGELRKAGVSLKLHPKPFRLLLLLTQHSGQVVTREEIQHCLWGDNTFVDFERGINYCVNQIRATLGDDAEKPRYVETLPRCGYRFIAPVNLVGATKLAIPSDCVSLAQDHTKAAARYVASTSSAQEIHAAPLHLAQEIAIPQTKSLARALIVALSLTAILTAGFVFYFHRAPELTDKDSLVIADFTNTTGDPVFDGALRQGLAVELEQSPFFNVISEEQTAQALRLMAQPVGVKVTGELANELCQREGGMAVLEGTVGNLGGEYVIGLRAENCQTGQTLAQSQVTASDKKQVLRALGKAATEIRSKLGESRGTVQKFNTPLEQATTPSLEALQAYSLGRTEMDRKGDNHAAVPLFQRATQLDPNFAMAYASLGTSYANLGENGLSADNTKRAYELRERLSQREGFYIEAHYYEQVTGDLEKARQVYELWAQTFPRDFVPPDNLVGIYTQLGQHEKLLELADESLRLNSTSGSAYADMTETYIYLNRFEDARATAEEALSKNLDTPKLHHELYLLAFIRNDAAEMLRQASWGAGKPGMEDVGLALEADTAAYFGQLRMARALSRRAVVSAQSAGEIETAAGYEAFSALRESLMGNSGEARQRVAAALKLSTGRDVLAAAALALTFAGDQSRSQALTADLAKRFPMDTIVKVNYLPTIQAQLALSRNNLSRAIEAAQATAAYELGVPVFTEYSQALYPIYVRGGAYLASRRSHEAAVEFQKIVDQRGIAQNKPMGALAHLQIGRAYAMQGDTAKAKAAYQDFLTLWKDADPDIPIFIAAKAEYAKLQ
jgi:eukaryotic-like serine/threonine-protein kinase